MGLFCYPENEIKHKSVDQDILKHKIVITKKKLVIGKRDLPVFTDDDFAGFFLWTKMMPKSTIIFMKNVIEIKDLKKQFGRLKAVDGITFEVKEGEIFGFLGPNGAGKSTTIRCLMGFNRVTSGSATILGKDLFEDGVAVKRDVGYLPGNVKLYDEWTGWEHIHFYESIRGKSDIVESLISKLDYNPNARFRHLSSGNKQKLGLILALMNEPKVLIMDEPTVGLDPLLQNTIYGILLGLKKKGTTIFISSHNLPEVEKLCDRVAIIKEGKLVAIESINDLGDKKLHRIEARFSGSYKTSEFQVDGVDSVEEISEGVIITVSGDINPILSKLAKYKVTDLEITHANLEEVFMKFYERKQS